MAASKKKVVDPHAKCGPPVWKGSRWMCMNHRPPQQSAKTHHQYLAEVKATPPKPRVTKGGEAAVLAALGERVARLEAAPALGSRSAELEASVARIDEVFSAYDFTETAGKGKSGSKSG